MRERLSEHAVACAVVHDSIGGLDCGTFKAFCHGGNRVSFQTTYATANGIGCIVCMPHEVGQHFGHGRILFSPSVPKCASRVESKHLKIGQKAIQAGDEAVGPAAVELIGEGGVHCGHGNSGL